LNRAEKIFLTKEDLAETFADDLINRIKNAGKINKSFTVALSGGGTPKILFDILAEKSNKSIGWNQVHFFWVDERCVPPSDHESNFGMTKNILLNKINIPEKNIHRIHGEADPLKEADRYSREVLKHNRKINNLPLIDVVLLGMGDDGHTASIFPGNLNLFNSEKICEVASHPFTGQKRITLTGKVINNADAIFFIVTGSSKAVIVEQIFKEDPLSVNYPATYIKPFHGSLTWLLDKKAGKFI